MPFLFFCWAYTGVVPPPSPSHTHPYNCTNGAWLPARTVIMLGTYDNEDTRLNPPRK